MVESVGGKLECYYWVFGQYDGMAVFEMPDAHTTAATSLAIVSSGAFTRFETHELIEASDLTAIAERAREIAYQPPGGWQAGRPAEYVPGHESSSPAARVNAPALMGMDETARRRRQGRVKPGCAIPSNRILRKASTT